MLVSMEALHMREGRRYGLGASIVIPPRGRFGRGDGDGQREHAGARRPGNVRRGRDADDAEPGSEFGRLQGAVPALAERVGDRLAAAA